MDLIQAEAVAEFISAKSELQWQKIHLCKIEGSLSKLVNSNKSRVNRFSIITMELDLDFSEEDLEIIQTNQLLRKIIKLKYINRIIKKFQYGQYSKQRM